MMIVSEPSEQLENTLVITELKGVSRAQTILRGTQTFLVPWILLAVFFGHGLNVQHSWRGTVLVGGHNNFQKNATNSTVPTPANYTYERFKCGERLANGRTMSCFLPIPLNSKNKRWYFGFAWPPIWPVLGVQIQWICCLTLPAVIVFNVLLLKATWNGIRMASYPHRKRRLAYICISLLIMIASTVINGITMRCMWYSDWAQDTILDEISKLKRSGLIESYEFSSVEVVCSVDSWEFCYYASVLSCLLCVLDLLSVKKMLTVIEKKMEGSVLSSSDPMNLLNFAAKPATPLSLTSPSHLEPIEPLTPLSPLPALNFSPVPLEVFPSSSGIAFEQGGQPLSPKPASARTSAPSSSDPSAKSGSLESLTVQSSSESRTVPSDSLAGSGESLTVQMPPPTELKPQTEIPNSNPQTQATPSTPEISRTPVSNLTLISTSSSAPVFHSQPLLGDTRLFV